MYINEILQHKYIEKKGFINDSEYHSIIILFFIIILYLYLNSKMDNHFLSTIIMILLLYLIIFFINYKMLTNKNLSNIYIPPEKISKQVNTGDIVLFRSYDFTNLNEIVFFYFGLPLILTTFFTHMGMIYKNSQGNVFIIESNALLHHCRLNKKVKEGLQVMNFIDRVSSSKYHRIHVVKSDLYKFIDNEKFFNSLEKYKDYKFNQNGVYCINLITNILNENGVLKNPTIFPYLFNDVIDPINYKVPVKFQEPILVKEYVY